MQSTLTLTRVRSCQLKCTNRALFPGSRMTRIITARGNKSSEPKPPSEENAGALQTALRAASATWDKLDTQQRVYTVVAGSALLVAAPQLLTFLVIAIERLLVGGLLAVEEVIAATLLLGTRLIVVVGSLALLAVGTYLFVFKKQRS